MQIFCRSFVSVLLIRNGWICQEKLPWLLLQQLQLRLSLLFSSLCPSPRYCRKDSGQIVTVVRKIRCDVTDCSSPSGLTYFLVVPVAAA